MTTPSHSGSTKTKKTKTEPTAPPDPQIQRLAEAVNESDNRPPWVTGSVQVAEKDLYLFFVTGKDDGKDEEKDGGLEARRIPLPPSPLSLSLLTSACTPATFGLADQDVLDETYRKAGKMDAERFSLNFCPEREGIVGRIEENLLGWDEEGRGVGVEIYKLNVYGKDAFFKAHKDTPRSCEMFGSLVVVLPIPHEGGGLLLKHNQYETVFDSAAELAGTGTGRPETTVAFAAFYSDVEHEVLKVTAGHRVTVTYNLYFVDGPGEDGDSEDSVCALPRLPQATLQSASTLSKVIQQLLDNPTFLPEGGWLGFGLKHQYPVEALDKCHTEANLEGLRRRLKGADAAVARAWADCGIAIDLKLIYHMEGKTAMSDQAPLVEYGLDDVVRTLRHDDELNFRVIGRDADADHWGKGRVDVPVIWVTAWTGNAPFNSAYVAYGNDASLGFLYGNVAMIVEVGPVGKRDWGMD